MSPEKSEIQIILVKKNKKNESEILKALNLIDKEVFMPGTHDVSSMCIFRAFWNSRTNRIVVAKRVGTGAILGYAIFTIGDVTDERFGKQRIKTCYLQRMAVRVANQNQGIYEQLIDHILLNHS